MVTPIIYTGSQFKHLREKQGVSIYALSKQTGVPEQTISLFEREERTLYVSTLAKLLTGLNSLKTRGNGKDGE
jgi:transcriptional regulator with XRE-family HTH domain